MGQDVEKREFTREDRTRYRAKVRQCLDVFARMLREARFDSDRPMTGLEVELNLVDHSFDPAMRNAEALEAIADPAFVTELERPRQPQRGRGEGVGDRCAHGARRHPADASDLAHAA